MPEPQKPQKRGKKTALRCHICHVSLAKSSGWQFGSECEECGVVYCNEDCHPEGHIARTPRPGDEDADQICDNCGAGITVGCGA